MLRVACRGKHWLLPVPAWDYPGFANSSLSRTDHVYCPLTSRGPLKSGRKLSSWRTRLRAGFLKGKVIIYNPIEQYLTTQYSKLSSLTEYFSALPLGRCARFTALYKTRGALLGGGQAASQNHTAFHSSRIFPLAKIAVW